MFVIFLVWGYGWLLFVFVCSDFWIHHRREHVGFAMSFLALNVKKKKRTLYIITSLCAEICPIYSIFLFHWLKAFEAFVILLLRNELGYEVVF